MTEWPSCPSASVSDADTSARPPVFANGCASEATISTDNGVPDGAPMRAARGAGAARAFLGAAGASRALRRAGRRARGRFTGGGCISGIAASGTSGEPSSCLPTWLSAVLATLGSAFCAVFFGSAFLTGCRFLTLLLRILVWHSALDAPTEGYTNAQFSTPVRARATGGPGVSAVLESSSAKIGA